MCMMCEGFDLEETLDHDRELIDRYGFIVTGVADGAAPWLYTVGLQEAVGHPEIVLAGPAAEHAARLLNDVGRAVLDGARFGPGDTWPSSEGRLRFGAVHPVQFRLGTFNVWKNMVDSGRLASDGYEAMQVFAPRAWFCPGHEVCQPDLARPESRVGIAVDAAEPGRAASAAQLTNSVVASQVVRNTSPSRSRRPVWTMPRR
jgi:Domain of unknown function (DUF4262)